MGGDLGTWAPQPGCFDLVSCLYVHVAGSVVEMVRRPGRGVAEGRPRAAVGTGVDAVLRAVRRP